MPSGQGSRDSESVTDSPSPPDESSELGLRLCATLDKAPPAVWPQFH